MFESELKTLKEAIVADYREWTERMLLANDYSFEGFEEKMQNFAEGLEIEEGDGRRKYIKIKLNDSGRSVWGFIAKKDGKGFRAGDIMKAAGWNAPAMNKARGNILDGGYSIRWTGPNYL